MDCETRAEGKWECATFCVGCVGHTDKQRRDMNWSWVWIIYALREIQVLGASASLLWCLCRVLVAFNPSSIFCTQNKRQWQPRSVPRSKNSLEAQMKPEQIIGEIKKEINEGVKPSKLFLGWWGWFPTGSTSNVEMKLKSLKQENMLKYMMWKGIKHEIVVWVIFWGVSVPRAFEERMCALAGSQKYIPQNKTNKPIPPDEISRSAEYRTCQSDCGVHLVTFFSWHWPRLTFTKSSLQTWIWGFNSWKWQKLEEKKKTTNFERLQITKNTPVAWKSLLEECGFSPIFISFLTWCFSSDRTSNRLIN